MWGIQPSISVKCFGDTQNCIPYTRISHHDLLLRIFLLLTFITLLFITLFFSPRDFKVLITQQHSNGQNLIRRQKERRLKVYTEKIKWNLCFAIAVQDRIVIERSFDRVRNFRHLVRKQSSTSCLLVFNLSHKCKTR